MEKAQQPTMHKNNSRNSGGIKGCGPLQLSCDLTGLKSAIGYIFLCESLGASEKNDTADNLLHKDRNRKKQYNEQPTHKTAHLQARHTSRCFSLQKSSFLADTPAGNCIFDMLNYKGVLDE